MRSICLALVLAAAATAVNAAPAPTLSKREARTMAPDALKRRVLQQLGDILVEGPRPSGTKPKAPLSDLWFRIRPHATDFEDVCVSESVSIRFDHGGARNANGDTPAEVVGLEAKSSFFVAKDRHVIRCDRLKPFDDHFIFADGAGQARTAVRILQRIRTEPELRAVIACEETCPESLKSLTPDDIFSAFEAPTPPDRPSDEKTLTIDADQLRLTVSYVESPDVLTIRKVRVAEMVIFADARID